jgi:hypothetical protein
LIEEFGTWSEEKFGLEFLPFDHPFEKPEW